MADFPAGVFEQKATQRTADDGSEAGGGLMSVMRGGRVFEKSRRKHIDCFWKTWRGCAKNPWPHAVYLAWKTIRGSGRPVFRWLRICKTRMRQRFT